MIKVLLFRLTVNIFSFRFLFFIAFNPTFKPREGEGGTVKGENLDEKIALAVDAILNNFEGLAVVNMKIYCILHLRDITHHFHGRRRRICPLKTPRSDK